MSRNTREWILGVGALVLISAAIVWGIYGFPLPNALRCRGLEGGEAWACRMEARYDMLDILNVENTVSENDGRRLFGVVLDIVGQPQDPEALMGQVQGALASGADELAQPGRELYAVLVLEEVSPGQYVAVAEIDCDAVPRNLFELEMCDVFGIPGVPADHLVQWPGR